MSRTVTTWLTGERPLAALADSHQSEDGGNVNPSASSLGPSAGPPDEALARRLLDTLTRAAVVEEAVGVLRCWHQCDTAQARHELTRHRGTGGRDAEAARVLSLANAAAEQHTDPDWD
jgi:hypothetical protein